MATLLPTGAAASDAPLWGASAVEIAHGVPVGAGPPLSSSALDAVPLIDQTTAALLSQVNAFSVVQRPSLSEALFAACERSNIYDVYDGQSGAHLFFAKERSGTCARFCCAPNHALVVEFKVAAGMDPMFKMVVDIDTLPTVLTMEREGCWGKPLLGCCALTAGCKDGMYLHAGSVGLANPGDVKLASAQCVSFATQPLLAGGFTPTLNVMERAGPGWTPLAKVEGPCCFGGCLELCRSSKFTVSSLRAGQLESKLEVGDVATIIKQKPRSLEGALREMVTDADIYTLAFNPAVPLAPQQKATLLGALILADYMYFEHNAPMCDGNGCSLCNLHCAGCLCPCSLRGGGGRAAAPAGGGGGGALMADQ